jgi:hypothetical protein
MAVTVIVARDEHGGPTTREVFATATKYVISDGNLDVIMQGAGALGTYGSGNWLSVYMDDSVEVTTIKPAEEESSFGDFSFDSDDSDSDSSSEDSDSDTDSDSADSDSDSDSASTEDVELLTS